MIDNRDGVDYLSYCTFPSSPVRKEIHFNIRCLTRDRSLLRNCARLGEPFILMRQSAAYLSYHCSWWRDQTGTEY